MSIIRDFQMNGFVHLRNVLSKEFASFVERAVPIEKYGAYDSSRVWLYPMTKAWEELPLERVIRMYRHPLEELLGRPVSLSHPDFHGAQVSVIRSGRVADVSWHCDVFGKIYSGLTLDDLPHFQIGAAVYLSNLTLPHRGNLLVWPEGHHLLAELFRKHYEAYQEMILGLAQGVRVRNLRDRMHQDLYGRLGEPITIYSEPGDVVLFHALLPHAIDSNTGPDRPALIFRHGHYLKSGREALGESIWSNWARELQL